jgi:hypothetical protein
MNQAQGAIDAAKAAGAERYAPDEFHAAVAALDRSREAVTQRDYRQALNYALDARERARDAAHAGAEKMAQARGDAEQALHAITIARQNLRTRIEQGTSLHVADRPLADGHDTMTAAETAMQEARAAIGKQEYAAARSAADAALKRVNTAIADLDAALDARNPRRPARRPGRD